MGPAIRGLGVLLLGYPILLALVALVVLVGVIAILKFFVYDPLKAEQEKRYADRLKQMQREEWQRGLVAARSDARAARRRRRKKRKRRESSHGS